MATYKVQSNGNAPSNAKAGDYIETAGGTYKVLDGAKYKGMSTDQLKQIGVNYNPSSGLYSQKTNTAPQNTNTRLARGLPATTGKVNTNTSYNGSYINNLDLDTDWQAKINDAVSKGDYYSAAQYEANRNAKINYLNSISSNTGQWQTTKNYVSNYSNNNKGGQAQEGIWNYNDLKNGNLPDNWTTALVNGTRYRRDPNDGTIYSYGGPGADGNGSWTPVGNRINPSTGEWMFDSADTAREAAYANYARATGDYNPNALSPEYISRVQQGTQNQYAQQSAEQQLQRELAAQLYYDRIYGRNNNDGWYQNNQGTIDIASDYINNANVTPDQRQILHTNSFETDSTIPDDYHIYGVRNYSDPYSTWLQDLYRQYQYRRR